MAKRLSLRHTAILLTAQFLGQILIVFLCRYFISNRLHRLEAGIFLAILNSGAIGYAMWMMARPYSSNQNGVQ
ncbi:MAG: hypothetical protein P4L10_12950 [Acidobacteriaceae bacterium]|nr:hypothetical protein [Acidobacteriaceae bacterium]